MVGMKNACNDNTDTWQPLSLATGRLLVNLNKQTEEESGEDRKTSDGDKDKSANRLEYIERRMRDIAAFERLFSENGLRRKRGK
jgi:hypothetical protein